MTQSYLDAAREGKNDGWRYLLGLIVFPGIFLVGLSLVLLIGLIGFGGWELNDFKDHNWGRQLLQSLPIWASYVISAISGLGVLAGLAIAIEKLHQRSLHSVVNPNARFNLRRLSAAFGLWFALSCGNILIVYLLNPSRFTFTFDLSQWFLCLPFMAIATLTNASASETVRGYVLQGLGLMTRQPLLLIMLSALLSSFLGFNFRHPYVALCGFLLNIGLATFVLRDNCLELALGIQMARLSLSMIAQFKLPDSSVSLPSIFTQTASDYDLASVVGLIVRLAIFYAVFLRVPTSRRSPENAQE